HHFWQGEQSDKALDFLVRSGERAQRAYANQSALDYYARALDAAGRIEAGVPTKILTEIRERRSQLYIGIARYAEAIAEGERMVEVARARADRRAEGAALLQLAFAHWSTFSADHVPSAQRLTAEGLAIPREVDYETILARSLELQASLDQMNGDLAAADEKAQGAIRISESGRFQSLVLWSHVFLAAHDDWRGDFAKAAVGLRRAEEVARNAG